MLNKIFNDKQNMITAHNHVSVLLSYDLISQYVTYEHTANKITSLIICATIFIKLKYKYTFLE